jgi:hypothetical protein
MKKKLTLSIDEEIIKSAKIYADGTDRSLSELIQNYLVRITTGNLVEDQATDYNTKSKMEKAEEKEWEIPEFLKGIAGAVSLDIDYVKDREKIREERYSNI